MAANLGNCNGSSADFDSIVFKLIYDNITVMFTGDFKDVTSDPLEVKYIYLTVRLKI